jgi:hypothetical protein
MIVIESCQERLVRVSFAVMNVAKLIRYRICYLILIVPDHYSTENVFISLDKVKLLSYFAF